MGIDVSADKAVTINDDHENGVNTSVDANPSVGRFKGASLLHYFAETSGDRGVMTEIR